MAKKLHYLNLPGLAEAIRYMLHYSGQQFEDIRYDYQEWPIKSVKNSLPYGQLPLYEEGDRNLNQSIAIARYIAASNNLLPSDPWSQAILDAAVLNFYDFHKVMQSVFREQDTTKKEEIINDILENKIDFYFSRFEKELNANNGFFVGKLTWAEFVYTGLIETGNIILGIQMEKKYPAVEAMMDAVRSLPRVKEYIKNRDPYVFTSSSSL